MLSRSLGLVGLSFVRDEQLIIVCLHRRRRHLCPKQTGRHPYFFVSYVVTSNARASRETLIRGSLPLPLSSLSRRKGQLMWCLQCGAEYRTGLTGCPACASSTASALVFGRKEVGEVLYCLVVLLIISACVLSNARDGTDWRLLAWPFGPAAIIWLLILCGTRELSIDFSRSCYQLRSGIWPFIRTTKGSLGEFSHLCLETSTWRRYAPRHDYVGVPMYCVRANLVWEGQHVKDFTLVSVNTNRDDKSLAEAKKALTPSMVLMARRLHVSCFDIDPRSNARSRLTIPVGNDREG